MVKLIKVGNNFISSEHHEYQVRDENDIQDLPGLDVCQVGSLAYTADFNMIWNLGDDDVWHLVGGDE